MNLLDLLKKYILKAFYDLFLFFYKLIIRIASIWNPKAKRWLEGRRNYFQRIQEIPKQEKTVWMHAASLGEFEQGRPVLKLIREHFPKTSFIITFFSPSGYQIATKDKEFRQVYYLPLDSGANARKMLDIIKPDLVLWVKYEFWHYYLQEISKRQIPVLLISGAFRSDQRFFKPFGKFWRNILNVFDHFFLQNQTSIDVLLNIIPERKITLSGDTRCDRVINIAANFNEVPGIREFCNGKQTIVAGSTWEDDEAEWVHFIKQNPDMRFIIAPHEVDDENIKDVRNEFKTSITYSAWIDGNFSNREKTNCMIIDNIGMLSRLYAYATITYVGGGFGYDGLHNILEAAVYGKPVIFGPEFEKNFEAKELIDSGGAFSVNSALELEKTVLNLLRHPEKLVASGKAAADYVQKNAGASEKIINYIRKNELL
ncbi:glycosyltransferase N-terminal domain-containing protein [soil metagenome]